MNGIRCRNNGEDNKYDTRYAKMEYFFVCLKFSVMFVILLFNGKSFKLYVYYSVSIISLIFCITVKSQLSFFEKVKNYTTSSQQEENKRENLVIDDF